MIGEGESGRDDDLGPTLARTTTTTSPGPLVTVALQVENQHSGQSGQLGLGPGPGSSTLAARPLQLLHLEVQVDQVLHRDLPLLPPLLTGPNFIS